MQRSCKNVAACASLGVVLAGAGHASASIFPNPVYSVEDPVAAATGDFNGDGAPDLVTVSDSYDHVSILLNQGDGTLGSEAQFATGDWPQDIAVADLNGDGALDLVTANKNDLSISVLLGNGDGTFGGFTSYFAGQYPTAVAIDDLSGDSVPDIVVAAKGMDSLAVLLGNGDGTFGGATLISTMYEPVDVVIADVNLDGVLDLAALNASTATLAVFIGQGGGLFTAPPQYYSSGGTILLVSADFNGDGAPDLATGDRLFLNDGHGAFSMTQLNDIGGVADAGDVNGDGITDLLTRGGGTVVSLVLCNGDGTFASAVSYDIYADSVMLGDLDGDGAPDVVTLRENYDAVVVLSGNGDGTLATPPTYDTGGAPRNVLTDDLDGDGVLDLVALSNGVYVLMGQGDGTFADAVLNNGGGGGYGDLGDVNNDGILDLVASAGVDTVGVWLGVGDGTFGTPSVFDVYETYPRGIQVGDVDGDGNADVALMTNSEYHDGYLNILLGHGDGTFAAPQTYLAHFSATDMKLGDLNGDGALDAIVANEGFLDIDDGSVSVLLNNGDGSFADRVQYQAGWCLGDLAVGDLDGDGNLDIAVSDYQSVGHVWLGAGDGTLDAATSYSIGDAGWAICMADFNNDDTLDLAVTRYNIGHLALLLGEGDGTFGEAMDFLHGTEELTPGDFNGDGLVDLAVTGRDFDLMILLNQMTPECPGDLDGDLDVDQADLGILLASYGQDAGGDIDGDGDTDQADLGALLGNYGEDC